MSDQISRCRRNFLRSMGVLTAGLAVSSTSLAKAVVARPERHLSLHNLHTGESLTATFCVGGDFDPQSLHEINHLLRDHRTGEACVMDPQLLVLLDELKQRVGKSQPFHVISGYRSPRTNEMLRQNSNGVARKSLHMQGKAIDVRLPGIDIHTLQKAALSLKGGGVGLYTRSDFIHLDVGRVRSWGS